MRMIRIDLEHPRKPKIPLAACIGYFDGMHRGHQALIHRTEELAQELHCESALITFEPDPWVTIKGMSPADAEHITTMRQRINLAVSYGIENICILEFTKAMADLSPEEFAERVLGQLNLSGLVCGYDFHYGYLGKGDSETLKQYGSFRVEVVEEVADGSDKISSTRISKLLEHGEIEEAERLLGHPFEMKGKVIPGRHKGTSLGFPTANIQISPEYLTPKPGVYSGSVLIDGIRHPAMINLGHNPTMNYTERLSLEAHILDYSGNLYGRMLTLRFSHYLRPEIHFQSKDNLIMQLEQDVRSVRKLEHA